MTEQEMTTLHELHDDGDISADRLRVVDHNWQVGPTIQLRSSAKYPLLVDHDQNATAEYFGILRTRVLNARSKSGFCSVLISSTETQEGKTLISLNLAISLAQLRRERILLVDGDLRRKGISQLLGVRQSPGLGDFLCGRLPLDACVQATSLPHLFVTSAGQIEERDVPAALEGPRWNDFIEVAKGAFGVTIVDSVPVTAPIADFELLLGACDVALLVVRLRKAKWEGLELATSRMNGKLLGVVVNNSAACTEYDQYAHPRGKRKSTATT